MGWRRQRIAAADPTNDVRMDFLKLPSIKLPALKFPLPKLGGGLMARFRKGKDKEDDEDIEADMLDGIDVDAADEAPAGDGAAGEEEGASPPPRAGGGLDDDEDGDLEGLDDDLDGPGTFANRKRLIIIAGAAALLLAFVIGGAGWFLFSGDDTVSVVEGKAQSPGAGDGAGLIERPTAVVPPPEGPEGVPRVIAALPPRGSAGLMTLPGGAAPEASATGTTVEGGIGVEDPQLGLVVAAVTPASFVGLPDLPAAEPLPAAPLPGLFEDGDHGMLPRIGSDGKTPLQAYARPFSGAADLIRVAVIVKGLGLNRASTNAAIRKLPPEVTMAFSPYAQGVSDWARFARERGHETLIELPLEPREFPVLDPGPYALRTLADPADNQRLLEFVLGRGAGYVGVIGTMGSKYSQNKEQLGATLTHLKARGVMYVDASNGETSLAPGLAKSLSLPRAMVDVDLDRVASRAAVAGHLSQVEGIARKKAVAVLAVDPTPVVIEALAAWIATLEEKGLVLAPISALADKQLF